MRPDQRPKELNATWEGFDSAFEDSKRLCLCGDLSHKFFETEDVEDAGEVIAERHQAPFAADLVEAANQEVSVAGAALERAERVLDNPRTTTHQLGGALHPRTMTIENIFVLPATDAALSCLR